MANTTLLEQQSVNQAEVAKQQQERQTQFEKEVREALTRIETKRAQDQTSPRGGIDFEDEVTRFVNAATLGGPCVFSVVGTTPGVGRCKKGDAVLRFTAESAFANAGVVFEAKREAGYTVQAALDDLDDSCDDPVELDLGHKHTKSTRPRDESGFSDQASL